MAQIAGEPIAAGPIAGEAASVAPQNEGVLAFGPLALAGSVAVNLNAEGVVAFSGLHLAGSLKPPATGALDFTGVAFAAYSGVEQTGGRIGFGGLGFAGDVHVPPRAGASLAFSGITIEAGGGARISEVFIAVMGAPAISGQVAELDIGVVARPGGVVARVAEIDVAVVATPSGTTLAQVPEVDVGVLAYIAPCATRRCQVWKLTLTNGQVYAFTSHDMPVTWLGVTYGPCKSLSQTASESSSELKSTGGVELTGILDSSAISDEDLYSGLFDDAFVEVWVIPWDGQPDDQAPFRQAAGWLGKVTRGEYNFTADVMGPGAKLGQAAVVDFFTPACRWTFGVLDAATGLGCPVSIPDLQIENIPVTGSILRSEIMFTAANPGGTAIWDQGTIVWQTGRNAGVTCQTETVDFGAQALSLWDLAPYPPAVGDLFTLQPGCPKIPSACNSYGVFVEAFGGFPNVPGPDSLQSNADSLFT